MRQTYDRIVIGAGTAAQTAISRVRKAGWQVAVIDHRPFGGTCALRGWDPKKMLVSGDEAIDAARRMIGHGVEGELRISWPQLMAFKRTFTDPIPEKQEKRYAALGVDVFHCSAQFVTPGTIAVGGKNLKSRNVLSATGARPVPLGIPGENLVDSSDNFLELPELPRRIVLIGGGYSCRVFPYRRAGWRKGNNNTAWRPSSPAVRRRCGQLLDAAIWRARNISSYEGDRHGGGAKHRWPPDMRKGTGYGRLDSRGGYRGPRCGARSRSRGAEPGSRRSRR